MLRFKLLSMVILSCIISLSCLTMVSCGGGSDSSNTASNNNNGGGDDGGGDNGGDGDNGGGGGTGGGDGDNNEVVTNKLHELPKPDKYMSAKPVTTETTTASTYNVESLFNGTQSMYTDEVQGEYSADAIIAPVGGIYQSPQFINDGALVPCKIKPVPIIIWFNPCGPAILPKPIIINVPEGVSEPYISWALNDMLMKIDWNTVPTETTIKLSKWLETSESYNEAAQALAIGYDPVKLGLQSGSGNSSLSSKSTYQLSITRLYGNVAMEFVNPPVVIGKIDMQPLYVARQQLKQEITAFIQTELDDDTLNRAFNGYLSYVDPNTGVSVDANARAALNTALASSSTRMTIVMKGNSTQLRAVYSITDLDALVTEFFAKNTPVYGSAELQLMDGSVAWINWSGKTRVRRTGYATIALDADNTVNHSGDQIYVTAVVRVNVPIRTPEDRAALHRYVLRNSRLQGSIYNSRRTFTGSRAVYETELFDTETGVNIQFMGTKFGAYSWYSYSGANGEESKCYSDWTIFVGPKAMATRRGQTYKPGYKLNNGWVF